MKLGPDTVFGRPPRSLAVGYFCLGSALVVATDLALASMAGSLATWTPVRAAVGVAFVALSSVALYGATAYQERRAVAAQSELDTSNQQLQVLSRVFRHNVRNDLNIIQGYADLLDDRVDDDRSQEFLQTIRETTDDVVEISEKLRVIEETSAAPPTGRVNLADSVRDAAAGVDRAGVSLTIDAPAEAWVRADASIKYPIREVFENAVTHNDESVRRVDAHVTENGTTASLEVRDNGPGIPDDEQAVLRAEEETPLSHASSIGLWLVKWMCETQGGTVGFETSDDGTTVRLRFDAAEDPPSTTSADRSVGRDTSAGRRGAGSDVAGSADVAADGAGGEEGE